MITKNQIKLIKSLRLKKNRIQSYVFEIKRFIAICTSGGGREKIRGNWVAKLIKLPDVTWCDLYLDIT